MATNTLHWNTDTSQISESAPTIVMDVNGHDLARTHFTFRNTGPSAAFSITVDTIRLEGQTMDFEPIAELRAGASRTCLSIVYPVVGNDPHWAFDFWTASGEGFAVPFVVRYEDAEGGPLTALNLLEFDGHKVMLAPDKSAVSGSGQTP